MGPLDLSDAAKSFLDIKSRSGLAAWLGVSDRKLRYILYVLSSGDKYATFKIKKRNGHDRRIDAPIKLLKRAQTKIHLAMSEIAPASGIAKGFVKQKSIYDHAKLHKSKKWIVIADLESFFPSINFGRTRGAFAARPFLFPADVATCLAQLCCKDNELPQGAPTSPVLSNLICRRLDRALVALAKKNMCAVSRYADDICFSTNLRSVPDGIASCAEDGVFSPGIDLVAAIRSNGFSLNTSKFKVIGQRDQQMVTGLVVNRRVAPPRRWKRQLRTVLHVLDKHGEAKGLEIINSWDRLATRSARSASIAQVVRGKARFARWLDLLTGSKFIESLHRGYPRIRKYLPRVKPAVSLRLMTEGDTDAIHLEAALTQFHESGEFLELEPKFKNYSGDKGDRDLWETLLRIAKSDVDELTVGIFDCDNLSFMKEKGADPGVEIKLGRMVYALFLARPEPSVLGAFCIESLYPREESTQFTPERRRLFFGDEFNSATGVDSSGIFKREHPKKSAVVLSDKVVEISNGSSALLSKMEFAKMVSARNAPFSDISFEGFSPTFKRLREIVDAH